MRRFVTVALLAAALVIAGCGQRTVRTISIAGESWTVYLDDGSGMRGITGFGVADGMLFDLGREVDPGGVAFGMEGVTIPLDIAWFDGDGMVVSVASMEPCAVQPCPLYHASGPYRWAVEAPVGAFGDLQPPDSLVVGG